MSRALFKEISSNGWCVTRIDEVVANGHVSTYPRMLVLPRMVIEHILFEFLFISIGFEQRSKGALVWEEINVGNLHFYIQRGKNIFLGANYPQFFLPPSQKSNQTDNDGDEMMSYVSSALKQNGPKVWLSSLLFSGIFVGYIHYITFPSHNLYKSIPAFQSSSASILKLKEEIKALQQKIDILQRRYVRLE